LDQARIPVNKQENEREFPGLFHLGSMGLDANRKAYAGFLKIVWPELSSEFHELQLYLAGRNMPIGLKKKGYFPA